MNLISGRSQTTLTRFCPLLTTYPPLLTFVEELFYWNEGESHTVDISNTSPLPCLVNIVCECPLTMMTLHQILKSFQPWHTKLGSCDQKWHALKFKSTFLILYNVHIYKLLNWALKSIAMFVFSKINLLCKNCLKSMIELTYSILPKCRIHGNEKENLVFI